MHPYTAGEPMFYEAGCYGRVVLGELPAAVQQRLADLPGEWLEFDPSTESIVVRHIQPSSAPCLPTIAREVVSMLAEIPVAAQEAICGGDLYVHTETSGQLVRLRIERGGNLQICWAHPDYASSERKLYTGDLRPLVDPTVQRLNGCVLLTSVEPENAARELQALADNFEGLYPEGEFVVVTDETGKVQVWMHDLNLDVQLLVDSLHQLALPGSLYGRIDVSSFAVAAPEQHARFYFEEGKTWVQRPALWADRSPDLASVASSAA